MKCLNWSPSSFGSGSFGVGDGVGAVDSGSSVAVVFVGVESESASADGASAVSAVLAVSLDLAAKISAGDAEKMAAARASGRRIMVFGY